MRKIYVVGSINRDLVVYVDGLPRPGETVFGNRFQQFPGGKGANQAVAASRLGGDVHLVGNVGSDAFGKDMVDFLAGENIDTSEIAILDTAPTSSRLLRWTRLPRTPLLWYRAPIWFGTRGISRV